MPKVIAWTRMSLRRPDEPSNGITIGNDISDLEHRSLIPNLDLAYYNSLLTILKQTDLVGL